MNKESIEFRGNRLSPRELTLREIEQVLIDIRDGQPSQVESMVPDEPVSALAMAISVGVDPDDLLDLTPSQVQTLAGQVREKNPSLARAIENLSALAAQILNEEQAAQKETMLRESSTASAETPAD